MRHLKQTLFSSKFKNSFSTKVLALNSSRFSISTQCNKSRLAWPTKQFNNKAIAGKAYQYGWPILCQLCQGHKNSVFPIIAHTRYRVCTSKTGAESISSMGNLMPPSGLPQRGVSLIKKITKGALPIKGGPLGIRGEHSKAVSPIVLNMIYFKDATKFESRKKIGFSQVCRSYEARFKNACISREALVRTKLSFIGHSSNYMNSERAIRQSINPLNRNTLTQYNSNKAMQNIYSWPTINMMLPIISKPVLCRSQKNSSTSSISYNFNEHLNKHVSGNNEFFWNQCFDKGRLKNFVLWFVLNYGEQKTLELVEELKNLGFKYATKAGISLGIDDLKIPPKKGDLIFEGEKVTLLTIKQYKRGEITGVERFQRLIDTWHRTSENLKQEVIDYFEKTDRLNPVYMMAFSGARGNISQVRQLVGMRGLMSNPQGQIIDYPIRSNFREGLTLTEYIISSYGARKGIVDTALRTANAGYLTRRLVDVAQHVIISNFDCKTNSGIFLTDMKEGNKIIYSLQNRLVGRILGENINISNWAADSPKPKEGKIQKEYLQLKKKSGLKIIQKNTEISLDLSFDISKTHKKVFVRSVLTCNNKKLVCQLCYGWSLAQGNLVSIGEAVGIIAAQSIGEPGTQLTMRTFHTGGVFSGGVTDQIKAPFDSFIEYGEPIAGKLVRTPEGKIAFLTTNEGFFVIKDCFNNASTSPSKPIANNTSLKPSQNGREMAQTKLTVKKYKIPIYTLLFKRMGEKVFSNEVIAQISSLSNQKNATDDEELTIKSELEGQLYGKGVLVKMTEIGPKLRKDEGSHRGAIPFDPLFQAAYWGESWVLSGKIYRLPLASSFFPMIGDFINRKTVMNQIKWKFHKEGFLNSSSLEFYSNIVGTAQQTKQIKPQIQPNKFNIRANPDILNSFGQKTNLISSYFKIYKNKISNSQSFAGDKTLRDSGKPITQTLLESEFPSYQDSKAMLNVSRYFTYGSALSNRKSKSQSNNKTEMVLLSGLPSNATPIKIGGGHNNPKTLPTNGTPIVNVPSIKHSLLSFNVKNVVYKKYGYSLQVASGINPEFILNWALFFIVKAAPFFAKKNLNKTKYDAKLEQSYTFSKRIASYGTNSYPNGVSHHKTIRYQYIKSSWGQGRNSNNRINNKNLSKEDILLLISPLKSVENRKKGYDQNLWSGPQFSKTNKKKDRNSNFSNLRSSSSRVYLSNKQLNPFLNLSKSPSNWVPNFPFFLNWYPSNFQMAMPGIVFLENSNLRPSSTARLDPKVKIDCNLGFLPMKKPRFFLLNKQLKKQKENKLNFSSAAPSRISSTVLLKQNNGVIQTYKSENFINKSKLNSMSSLSFSQAGQGKNRSFSSTNNSLNFYLRITPKGFINILSLDKENKYKFQLDLISKSTLLWVSTTFKLASNFSRRLIENGSAGTRVSSPPLSLKRGREDLSNVLSEGYSSRHFSVLGQNNLKDSNWYKKYKQNSNFNSFLPSKAGYASFIKKEFIKKMQKQPNKKIVYGPHTLENRGSITEFFNNWGADNINKEIGENLHILPPEQLKEKMSTSDFSSVIDTGSLNSLNVGAEKLVPSDKIKSNSGSARTILAGSYNSDIPNKAKQNLKTQIECYGFMGPAHKMLKEYGKAINSSKTSNPYGFSNTHKNSIMPEPYASETLETNSIHFGVRWKNSYNYKQNLNLINLKVNQTLKELNSPTNIFMFSPGKFYFWEDTRNSNKRQNSMPYGSAINVSGTKVKKRAELGTELRKQSENRTFRVKSTQAKVVQSLTPWTKVVSKQRSSDTSITPVGSSFGFGRIFFTPQLFYEIPSGAPPHFSVLLQNTKSIVASDVGKVKLKSASPYIVLSRNKESKTIFYSASQYASRLYTPPVVGPQGHTIQNIPFQTGINPFSSARQFPVSAAELENTKANHFIKSNPHPFCYQINRQGFVKFAYSLNGPQGDYIMSRADQINQLLSVQLQPTDYNINRAHIIGNNPTLRQNQNYDSVHNSTPIYKGVIDFDFLFQRIKKSLFNNLFMGKTHKSRKVPQPGLPLKLSKTGLATIDYGRGIKSYIRDSSSKITPPYSLVIKGEQMIYSKTSKDYNVAINNNSLTKKKLIRATKLKGPRFSSLQYSDPTKSSAARFSMGIINIHETQNLDQLRTNQGSSSLKIGGVNKAVLLINHKNSFIKKKLTKSILGVSGSVMPINMVAQTNYSSAILSIDNTGEVNKKDEILNLSRLLYFFNYTNSQNSSNLKSFSKTIGYMWVLENKLAAAAFSKFANSKKGAGPNIFKRSEPITIKMKRSNISIFNFCVLSCIKMKSQKIWKIRPNFKKSKSISKLLNSMLSLKNTQFSITKTIKDKGKNSINLTSSSKILKSSLGWISLRNILSKFIKFELKKKKYIATSYEANSTLRVKSKISEFNGPIFLSNEKLSQSDKKEIPYIINYVCKDINPYGRMAYGSTVLSQPLFLKTARVNKIELLQNRNIGLGVSPFHTTQNPKNKLTIYLTVNPEDILIKKKLLCSKKDIINISKISLKSTKKLSSFNESANNPKNKFLQILSQILNPTATASLTSGVYNTKWNKRVQPKALISNEKNLNKYSKGLKFQQNTTFFKKNLVNYSFSYKTKIKSQSLKRKLSKTKNSKLVNFSPTNLVHTNKMSYTKGLNIKIKFGWIYFSNSVDSLLKQGGVGSPPNQNKTLKLPKKINKKYIFPGQSISDNLIFDNHICYVEALKNFNHPFIGQLDLGLVSAKLKSHNKSKSLPTNQPSLKVEPYRLSLRKTFDYKYSFSKTKETPLNLSHSSNKEVWTGKSYHISIKLKESSNWKWIANNKSTFNLNDPTIKIDEGSHFNGNSLLWRSHNRYTPSILLNRLVLLNQEAPPGGISKAVVTNNLQNVTELIESTPTGYDTYKTNDSNNTLLGDHVIHSNISNTSEVIISQSNKMVPAAFLIRKVIESKKPNLLEYKNKLYNSSNNAKEISDTLFPLNSRKKTHKNLKLSKFQLFAPLNTKGIYKSSKAELSYSVLLSASQLSLIKKLVYKMKVKSLFQNKQNTHNYKLGINIGTIFFDSEFLKISNSSKNRKANKTDWKLNNFSYKLKKLNLLLNKKFLFNKPYNSYNLKQKTNLVSNYKGSDFNKAKLTNISKKSEHLDSNIPIWGSPTNCLNKKKSNLVGSFNHGHRKIETISKFPNIDLKIVSNFKFYSSSKNSNNKQSIFNNLISSKSGLTDSKTTDFEPDLSSGPTKQPFKKAFEGWGLLSSSLEDQSDAILYRKPKMHSLFISYQISNGLRGIFEKDLYLFNYKNLRLTFNFQKLMYMQSSYPINKNLNSFLQNYLNKLTIYKAPLKKSVGSVPLWVMAPTKQFYLSEVDNTTKDLRKRNALLGDVDDLEPVGLGATLNMDIPKVSELNNFSGGLSQLNTKGIYNKDNEIFSLIPIIFNSPYFSYNFMQKLDNRFMLDNNFLNILSKLDVKNKNNDLTNFSLTPKKIETKSQFFTSGQNQLCSSNSFLPENKGKRYTNFAKNILGITSSYSAFQGEVIYTKDLAKIYKASLRNSGLKQGAISPQLNSLFVPKNSLESEGENTKKLSDSNFLQNSALILTKDDLISVSLKQKKVPSRTGVNPLDKSLMTSTTKVYSQTSIADSSTELIKPDDSLEYATLTGYASETKSLTDGSAIFFLGNTKPVLTNLDLLLQPSRITKKQISDKKSITTTNRFSKYHIKNILKEFEKQYLSKTVYYLNDVIIKYKKIAATKGVQSLKQNPPIKAKAFVNLETNTKYLINKLVVGLPIQRNNLSLGEFFKYGDKLQNNLTILETGQIIHLSKDKVTLRRGQRIKISINAILHKYHRDFITPQSPVITLSYSQLKTGDIVQGIPKIEQFFEARTTKRGRLFRDSLPNLLQALFKHKIANLTNDDAARESVYKIQQILIDGVQRVYRGQGVTIADKHLEVIVKQMTSKARILKGGCTGYLSGDVDDLFFIETVYNQYPYELEYEPLILGISKTSLEVKSFLSAASFQHTTRVLTKAAIYRETDYLSGLKENILLGNLIPAGTGYLVSVDSKIENQKS